MTESYYRTQFPTCPYCGHEHQENYFEFENGEHECEKCEKAFEVSIESCFSTEPIA